MDVTILKCYLTSNAPKFVFYYLKCRLFCYVVAGDVRRMNEVLKKKRNLYILQAFHVISIDLLLNSNCKISAGC